MGFAVGAVAASRKSYTVTLLKPVVSISVADFVSVISNIQ